MGKTGDPPIIKINTFYGDRMPDGHVFHTASVDVINVFTARTLS